MNTKVTQLMDNSKILRKEILDLAVDMIYNELDSSSSDFFTTEAGAVRGGYDFQLSSTEKGGLPFLSFGIGILFFFAYLIKSVLEFNFHILQGAMIFNFGPK